MKSKKIEKMIFKTIINILRKYVQKDEKIKCDKPTLKHSKKSTLGISKSLERLVKSKIPKINRYNIKFNYSLINDDDLGSIGKKEFILAIDDILENAINLCKNIENKNSRWLNLHVYREDMHLFIDIFNSANSGENVKITGSSLKHLRKFLENHDGILHSFSERFNIFFVEIQVLLKDGMIDMDINESKKYLFKGIPLYNYISQI